MQSTFSIPPLASGVVITVLVALVLVGGIQRIGDVAGRLVPFKAFLYVGGGLVAILINIDQVPAAVGLFLEHAFTPISATGGLLGETVWADIRFGVAREELSNEAGFAIALLASWR